MSAMQLYLRRLDVFSLDTWNHEEGNEYLCFLKAETPADLDAISKWLDIAGNKLDYRRYGEVLTSAELYLILILTLVLSQALLEILIAGGLLAPGGSIQQDGDKGPVSTSACIFQV